MQARFVSRFNDLGHIFVGAGRFLRHAAHGPAANENALRGKPPNDVLPLPLAKRLMPAHAPAGAVTGRTESELHTPRCAG